ncbi:MAG TPA: hypothetical protein VK889_08400 [Solirubrobacterales bacterium]|nr:hypothetical protein [Solirubrobacterales bacterium]
MIGTYASAALICAASLLVGRAVLALSGRRQWSWLEPAVGFGAIVAVSGALARLPGHGTSATLGILALLAVAALVVWRRPGEARGALRAGLPVALVVLVVLAIPFAVSGRWGLLGVGFNNDLGLHLAWAEWLRSGVGPTPDTGYPLGPHGLAVATAAVPGIGLGQAFIGEIIAIGVLTALTALAALRDLSPGRRLLAAVLVALPYLAASYFAQAAFKETAQALFALATALYLATVLRPAPATTARPDGAPSQDPPGNTPKASAASGFPGGSWLGVLPILALLGGIVFSYSFAGLAWPIAIAALWSLTLPEVRAALRPRRLLRFLLRPLTLVALLAAAGLGLLLTVGPLGFVGSFNKVAGSNTYGPVSPVEALGIWWTPNYRLAAAGGAQLTGLAGAISVLALIAGLAWWIGRRRLAIPAAFAACLALYLVSLPFSGDYSQAKALMIGAPLAMLVIVVPLLSELGRRLAWTALAAVFVAGAVCSSFLALRDAPVGPAGHGAELRAFLPILHGKPVLYAGQDRYAVYNLMGADTHVPLVEFPDDAVSQNPEKPFDTGDAYSPIDFDSFSKGTLNRFRYVITGRAAWDSAPPPNFRRVAKTPSYVLWEKVGDGEVSADRHVLLEGVEAGAFAACVAPEIRILLANPGRASLFPETVIGGKDRWSAGSVLGTGASTAQELELPAGSWNLSLQYFSPVDLTLSAPGFEEELKAALDGQRPNTISLRNNGQFWPAGRYESAGGEVPFTIATAEASALQGLSGYGGKAYVGELVAVRAEPHRTVALGAACDSWIDNYESKAAP